jgi:hypothetical protein
MPLHDVATVAPCFVFIWALIVWIGCIFAAVEVGRRKGLAVSGFVMGFLFGPAGVLFMYCQNGRPLEDYDQAALLRGIRTQLYALQKEIRTLNENTAPAPKPTDLKAFKAHYEALIPDPSAPPVEPPAKAETPAPPPARACDGCSTTGPVTRWHANNRDYHLCANCLDRVQKRSAAKR